nr:hypothetical protein GCM10020093_120160 [Planobispora longispora]
MGGPQLLQRLPYGAQLGGRLLASGLGRVPGVLRHAPRRLGGLSGGLGLAPRPLVRDRLLPGLAPRLLGLGPDPGGQPFGLLAGLPVVPGGVQSLPAASFGGLRPLLGGLRLGAGLRGLGLRRGDPRQGAALGRLQAFEEPGEQTAQLARGGQQAVGQRGGLGQRFGDGGGLLRAAGPGGGVGAGLPAVEAGPPALAPALFVQGFGRQRLPAVHARGRLPPRGLSPESLSSCALSREPLFSCGAPSARARRAGGIGFVLLARVLDHGGTLQQKLSRHA